MPLVCKDRPSRRFTLGFTPHRRGDKDRKPVLGFATASVVDMELVRVTKELRGHLRTIYLTPWWTDDLRELSDTARCCGGITEEVPLALEVVSRWCKAEIPPSLAESAVLWYQRLVNAWYRYQQLQQQRQQCSLGGADHADEEQSESPATSAEPPIGLVKNLQLFTQAPLGPSRRVRLGVADAVAFLVRQSPHDSVGFLTLTLPLVVHRYFHEHPEKRSVLLNRFIEEMSREWGRRVDNGHPFLYVGMMEIHPQLWNEDKFLAFHWHIAFQARIHRSSRWVFKVGELELILQRLISNVTGLQVDCNSALNLQLARTRVWREVSKDNANRLGLAESCGHALGRYLSKGCDDLAAEVVEAGLGHLLPQRGRKGWSLCSRELSAMVKADIADRSAKWTDSMTDYLERHLEAFVDLGLVAWSYRLPAKLHITPDGQTHALFGGVVAEWTSEASRRQVMAWCRDRYLPESYRTPPPPPVLQQRPSVIPSAAAAG